MQRTLAHPGDQLAYTATNGVTVTLQVTDGGTINRTVYTGTYRHEALNAAHADEHTARAEARRISEMARAGMTGDQIAALPVGLDGLAHLAGDRRHIRASRSRNQHRPLSEPLRRIVEVAASVGGTVRRSARANDRQLRALWSRGLGELNYRPGLGRHKVVESLTLNSRGWREAGTAVTA